MIDTLTESESHPLQKRTCSKMLRGQEMERGMKEGEDQSLQGLNIEGCWNKTKMR